MLYRSDNMKCYGYLCVIFCIFQVSLVQTAEEAAVRLVDGIRPTEGRVEYMYNGTWGTVCEISYWQYHNTQSVCKQLGLNPNGAEAKERAYFGEGEGPIWFSNVKCNGSESRLDDCDWNTTDCNHTEDVAVSCGPVMRLVGGESSNEGLVEIWYNNNWTEICAGSFSHTEAEIVCHHLGYNRTGSIAVPSLQFSWTRDEVRIKDVKCTGSESTLQRCNLHLLADTETCPTTDNAAVRCALKPPTVRLVNGITPYEGRIEVNYNGVWGTVCDEYWTKWAAAVICRQLGFDPLGAEKRRFAHYGVGTGPIWLNQVRCSGREARIEDCDLDGWGSSRFSCTHDDDAGVKCNAPIALAGGKVDYEGRVEFLYKKSWTGICDENWGSEEADVVCRHLGFNTSVRMDNVDTTKFGQSSVLTWMTNITCTGTESSLYDCFDGDDGHALVHSCSSPTLVFCSLGEPVIRLAAGKSFYEGRVEYRYNNMWGTVYENLIWKTTVAKVVCRQLRLPTVGAKPAYSESGLHKGSFTGEATGPIWMFLISCVGSEQTLNDCTHGIWLNYDVYQDIDHKFDVAVTCPAPVRLSGRRGNHEGLVEYYYKGEWGAVCGDGLNSSEAKVICDILGFNSSSPRMEQSSRIEQTNTSNWMYNVSCSGDETRLTECQIPFQWQKAGLCSNQAIVVCFDVPNEVRLVGGNNSYQGRVEYFYNGEWGTVCGDMFGYEEASVVCRQLGFITEGARRELNAYFGEGTGPIWLDDLRCKGTEVHLADCLHAEFGVHDCRHQHDVSVICNVPGPVEKVTIYKEQDKFIEGKNATLSCSTTETYPKANITWYVNGEEVAGTTTTAANYVITTKYGISTSILIFVPSRVGQDHARMPVVFCSAFNGLGSSISSSAKVTLDLIYGPDSVTIIPEKEQRVEEDKNTPPITCSAACEPECTISWYRGAIKEDSLIPSTDGVLQVNDVNRTQTGKYYCQAQNKITGKYATDFVDLEVIYGPTYVIFSPPTADITDIMPGYDLEVTCQADCSPECVVQWFKDTVSNQTKLVEGKLLKLTAVNKDSGGKYICQAKQLSIDNAVMTKMFTLAVEYAPVQDTSKETKTQLPIEEGKPSEMIFRASSNPPPTFKWYKLLADGTEEELKNPRIKQKDTSTSSTLEINEVKASDYGRYVVYAKNNRGTYSMVYNLESLLSVKSEEQSSKSQDLGVGAGIGLGILISAVVVVIVIVILYLVNKKRGPSLGVNGVSNGMFGSSFAMTDKR